jgi:hypothetical protein
LLVAGACNERWVGWDDGAAPSSARRKFDARTRIMMAEVNWLLGEVNFSEVRVSHTASLQSNMKPTTTTASRNHQNSR